MQILWEKVWSSSKKIKIALPYDPATSLLGIYPKEWKSKSQRDICTHVFPAALFVRAKM